ncbi:MAG: DUF3830 family protein [Marmoricola sp.]
MTRLVRIRLEKRDVSCVARLLEAEAPRTCAAVWDALPQGGDAFHAKYARNEVYTMVPRFSPDPVGPENTTVTPIPGDVMYFDFAAGVLDRGFRQQIGVDELPGAIDLAIFYGRNNLLLSPTQGFVRANVYATIVENFEAFAAACQDVWRGGAIGETLTYARVEGRS